MSGTLIQKQAVKEPVTDSRSLTHCWQCKEPLDEPAEIIEGIPVGVICDICMEKREAEYREKHPEEFQTAADQIRQWWSRFCPSEFKGTDQAWLNKHIREQLDNSRTWHPSNSNGQGLVLCGPSGAGKTRTLFLIMERLTRSGIRTEYWAAEDLARSISDSHDRRNGLELLVKRLVKVPVLAIDDLGQEKVTERVAEGLFTILRKRCDGQKPNLFTTMHDQNSLHYKYSLQEFCKDPAQNPHAERGTAIVRRITDYCQPVPFYEPLPVYNHQPELLP